MKYKSVTVSFHLKVVGTFSGVSIAKGHLFDRLIQHMKVIHITAV